MERAFMFLGYMSTQENLYTHLRACGFELMFKEIAHDDQGKAKGNVDVDLRHHRKIISTILRSLFTHLSFVLMRKILTVSRYVLCFAHSAPKEIWANIEHETVDIILRWCLTLYAMRYLGEYEHAVIVTSDGDFAPLVAFLLNQHKFLRIISPKRQLCSWLLRKQVGNKIDFLDSAREKLKKHP